MCYVVFRLFCALWISCFVFRVSCRVWCRVSCVIDCKSKPIVFKFVRGRRLFASLAYRTPRSLSPPDVNPKTSRRALVLWIFAHTVCYHLTVPTVCSLRPFCNGWQPLTFVHGLPFPFLSTHGWPPSSPARWLSALKSFLKRGMANRGGGGGGGTSWPSHRGEGVLIIIGNRPFSTAYSVFI